MTDPERCPKCGSELPPAAPAGICPKCLMQAGLASPTEEAEAAPAGPAAGFRPPPPEQLASLFPQLEIQCLLGVGGMGAVYRARQPALDRLVAVKILPPEVAADPAFAERFTREARALAQLGHQNIVAVYDFGQADGLYYFIMEYVEGTNLRQLMQAGEVAPDVALAIIPQICEALQFAHDEGIVHRDVKPENILVGRRGRVKIADFGLARIVGAPSQHPTLTATNQVLGTPHYMAPEQLRGTHTVDHRADIYSLGVVFYEMLTGDLPMGHFAPPSRRPTVDARLDDVVLRALAREPEDRYQQASEVKTAVEGVSSSVPAGRPEPAASNLPLKQPPVRQESHPRRLDSDGWRHGLAIPAAGLMIAGLLNTLCILAWIVLAVWGLASDGARLPILRGHEEAVMVWLFACFVLGALTLPAAVQMKRQRWYPLVILGVLLAMLPITPGALIGIPAGIWALLLLTRRETREMFAAGTPTDSWPGPSLAEAPPRFSRKAILGACWAPAFFVAAVLVILPTFMLQGSVEYSGQVGGVHVITPGEDAAKFAESHRMRHPAEAAESSGHSQVADASPRAVERESVIPASQPRAAVPIWVWILAAVVLPAGLLAPFGTTILGTLAISDIRHSQGRIVGLPLAVADALLYPLLLLDTLIVVLCTILLVVLASALAFAGLPRNAYSLFSALGLLIGIPLAVLADVLLVRHVWRKCTADSVRAEKSP